MVTGFMRLNPGPILALNPAVPAEQTVSIKQEALQVLVMSAAVGACPLAQQVSLLTKFQPLAHELLKLGGCCLSHEILHNGSGCSIFVHR